jgi:hypothetical protein
MEEEVHGLPGNSLLNLEKLGIPEGEDNTSTKRVVPAIFVSQIVHEDMSQNSKEISIIIYMFAHDIYTFLYVIRFWNIESIQFHLEEADMPTGQYLSLSHPVDLQRKEELSNEEAALLMDS